MTQHRTLHILRTNRIAFIVSRMSLYYQIKLTWFSGRRLTASVSCTIKQLNARKSCYRKKTRDAVRFGLMFADIHYKFNILISSWKSFSSTKNKNKSFLAITCVYYVCTWFGSGWFTVQTIVG